MGLSAYDFIDTVLNELTRCGAITPEQHRQEGLAEDLGMQADLAVEAIKQLAVRAARPDKALQSLLDELAGEMQYAELLEALVLRACAPGGIGPAEFTRPGGWRDNALAATGARRQVRLAKAAEALGFETVEQMQEHQRWLAACRRHRNEIREAMALARRTGVLDLRAVSWPSAASAQS